LNLQRNVWENSETKAKGGILDIYCDLRPIVTYTAIVWWPRVKFKRSRAELSKLQRMVCLGTTGGMKTAPTAAVEVITGLPHCTCRWS
jgi:hypothetical protein